MKILRLPLTLLFAMLSTCSIFAQNVGIGTTSPGTKLDVNGAITVRETSITVASNATTIPSNVSQVRLTGTATAAISITGSTPPNSGQELKIYNATTGGYAATLNSISIPNGQAMQFIYSDNGWRGLGAAGSSGAAGATGPTGPAGTAGATGPAGLAGSAGSAGATGPTGATGTAGAAGAMGPTGAAGAVGSAGAAGATGHTGVTGATGPTGLTGANGTNGAAGATGPTGAAGTNGTNGTTGATGAAGSNGAAGTQGPTGLTGAAGATGPTGAAGPTVLSVSNTSSANTLTTTVNSVTGTGVAIINTNTLSLSGTSITSTINGVASAALNLSALDLNIYNADGTLGGNRTMTMAADNLTFSSTTGNLIFNPSSTGRVGIGTASPGYALSVVAASNPLYLGGLQSGATTDSTLSILNGVVRKVPNAIKDIIGGLSSGGVTVTPNQTSGTYTGDSIILPPGRWLVTVNMLMEPLWPLFTPSNSSMWVQTTFSNTRTSPSPTTDVVGNNTLISGLMPPASPYANLSGSMVIENTSGANKTYYYATQSSFASGSGFTSGSSGASSTTGVGGTTLTNAVSIVSFGSSAAGENTILAIPIQ